jgi:peptidyl-prolyl cis-trans isomerase C
MSPRNRWLAFGCMCALVATGRAEGQLAPKPDPSPLAPGDLKRPIFDTQTPVYDTAGQQEKTANRVVAEVDGRPVTLGDVGDAIAALPAGARNLPFSDLFPRILAELVREQALVIRAQRQAVDEDPTVRRKMKAASDKVVANALLEQEASRSITEASLLERYNADVAGKPGPEEVHVRVIMTPTEAEAMKAIADLRGGADFATVAKRSSQDATASAGGDAGFVTLDRLTPEVGAVVFSLQPGQFTQFPVHSGASWFVLKVEDRRPGATPAFSVVRESLRQAMLRERAAAVVSAALAAVTVREFDITGKETDASSAGRAESGSAGRAESGSAGRAESGSAGRAESGSAGRAESGSAGRAESGSAGRAAAAH